MTIFDWNQLLQGIPDEWRQTKGEGVTIALIDSGADLTHPALEHLDSPGCKYFVGRPGMIYRPTPGDGNDNIADAMPLGSSHGTATLSVLAGRSPDDAIEGLQGLVPEAKVIMIKAIGAFNLSFLEYVLNGFRIASAHNADIVVCTLLPRMLPAVPVEIREAVFSELTAKKILFVSTLNNSNILSEFLDLEFPTTRPEAIRVGALRPAVLEALVQTPTSLKNIDVLMPPCPPVRVCTGLPRLGYLDQEISSSLATVTIAGVLALLLANWKKKEGESYHRRLRSEVMDALAEISSPFKPDQAAAGSNLCFYNLMGQPTV